MTHSDYTHVLVLCNSPRCLDNIVAAGFQGTLPLVDKTAWCQDCGDDAQYRLVFQGQHHQPDCEGVYPGPCTCEGMWTRLQALGYTAYSREVTT